MPLILSGDTGVPASGMPTGSVIQTVQGSLGSMTTTTSTSFVDTGLSASITPTSATSKILVMYSSSIGQDTAAGGQVHRIVRGSTEIFLSGVIYSGASGQIYAVAALQYLDSPATTSSTTYKIQFRTQASASACYFNADYGGATGETSTITLLEIKA